MLIDEMQHDKLQSPPTNTITYGNTHIGRGTLKFVVQKIPPPYSSSIDDLRYDM